jgi:hypothetical protein
LLPVVFGALVFKLSVWCEAEGCVSGKNTPDSDVKHSPVQIAQSIQIYIDNKTLDKIGKKFTER